MPLLFAVTLFVSASLLFMVQPMVGKMVLPLLGGSPAVWNACMVFFQALLLLGYLYAHKLVSVPNPRKQWMIHMGVLLLPLTVFALAAMFSTRNSPIAIIEALAPSDERSPILSVLAILTVAIGVPFFVISTTATLLQRWFVYTGHPSARDPYFLYAASNFGSLISLLGYPILIEPRLPIVTQAWVFAIGFAVLVGLIFICGRAAANPIGVPPASAQATGGRILAGATGTATTGRDSPRPAIAPTSEPPPTLARKLKWIVLAFVPSTLMLGVTFYMTTDIASVPLLWVGPLALYLITFIIAFGRVPDWFRILIGNLAPVMILLLVFTMISDVDPGFGIRILLHLIAFFAAALMCHYELARDRPAPQYLTEFFLLMSVGGVLGGVFNSLVAPLIFPHPWEYPIAIIIACLMVPKLLEEEADEAEPVAPNQPVRTLGEKVVAWLPFAGIVANTALIGIGLIALFDRAPTPLEPMPGMSLNPMQLFYIIGGLFLVGIVSFIAVELYGRRKLGKRWYTRELWAGTPVGLRAAALVAANPLVLPWAAVSVLRSRSQLRLYLDLVVPVVVGMGFYSLTMLTESERFLAACQGIQESVNLSIKTVALVTIYAVPVMVCFFFVDRPLRFALSVFAILGPLTYWESSAGLVHSERSFFGVLKIRESATRRLVPTNPKNPDYVFMNPDGTQMVTMQNKFRSLHHGTTLHGTQYAYVPGEDGKLLSRDFRDDFFMIAPGLSPWSAVTNTALIHAFDIREEPLTYYHPTGPVGAMFTELWRRKEGADAYAPIAMVGLGTGSVSCYARPGQSLTFYEIDPAVKHLVADQDKYFTFYNDALRRGAKLDIHMGDARLKLKDDTDRKYALLLVDAFSSDAIPVHLLTTEAVSLYLERMTDDGMLALHISNRWINLEPVVLAIANELGLTARVWNDNGERREGKTASSWVVLARKPEHLGGLYTPYANLALPMEPDSDGDIRLRYARLETPNGPRVFSLMDLPAHYTLRSDFEALTKENTKGKSKYAELNEANDAKAAWLKWIDDTLVTTTEPRLRERLKLCRHVIETYGLAVDLGDAMVAMQGHAFRQLETMSQVHAWTDDYSDVMRVMTIPEVRRVREFFGLPTVK